MTAIETQNLVHAFNGKQVMLHALNLQVPAGSIYGFLGPNGAGKTTTLRLILGLLNKQQGEILVFGKPFHNNRIHILKNTGSLIESPSLYGHLDAVDNLEIQRRIYRTPKKRIAEVLEIVGLSVTGRKKVRQFSLGMKQRLAIGIAILHQPSLLILDEPTNGLDPAGIIEMRELLKELNRQQGTTILVSSHLLTEIEKIATHVGILNQGQLLFQGTLQELHLKQSLASAICFETDNTEQALQLIQSQHADTSCSGTQILLHNAGKEQAAAINTMLVRNNIRVYGMSLQKTDLESIFIDLTKN
jgi:ABC-2 type transport system ATP-binding protein